MEENNAIAIIPSECFRWRARVQFIESFRTRAAALDFAGQNGYNLIVERNEGRNPLYDVLEDPEWACTTGLDLELMGTEEVLVDPGPNSWTKLLFLTVWDLSKRFAALMAILYARAIVPLSCRAFAIARIYLRKSVPLLRRAAAITAVYLWKIIPLARRSATVTSLFVRVEVAPRCRRAAVLTAIHLRKIIPLSRRAAAVSSLYIREEIAPRCRSAASRCWWSNTGLAFRRMWHRHTSGSVLDFARRSAAVGTLHARKISQGIGDAARRIQWADFASAFRRAWSTSYSTSCELSQRFAAAAGFYLREIIPLSRHTAAAIRTYLRDARERAQSTASNLSDSKSDQPRGNWVVAAQSHSNPSGIR